MPVPDIAKQTRSTVLPDIGLCQYRTSRSGGGLSPGSMIRVVSTRQRVAGYRRVSAEAKTLNRVSGTTGTRKADK
eukprot:3119339-Rhodomonas_salina.2